MTNPTPDAKVEQADREAAADLADLIARRDRPAHGERGDTLAGRCDHAPFVQLLARQRRAGLIEAAGIAEGRGREIAFATPALLTGNDIATAIRARADDEEMGR